MNKFATVLVHSIAAVVRSFVDPLGEPVDVCSNETARLQPARNLHAAQVQGKLDRQCHSVLIIAVPLDELLQHSDLQPAAVQSLYINSDTLRRRDCTLLSNVIRTKDTTARRVAEPTNSSLMRCRQECR